MIRGTTPTHEFEVSINTATIKTVRIIYSQKDDVLFVKENDDCTMRDNIITTTLTQEETFMFDHKNPVQIQIRALTGGGQAIATDIMERSVCQCLEEEVLV